MFVTYFMTLVCKCSKMCANATGDILYGALNKKKRVNITFVTPLFNFCLSKLMT